MFQSKGNGVFNPNPAPAPSPGSSPLYNICGSSLTDAKETCDRICETNDDCRTGEACFSDLSSSDCDGECTHDANMAYIFIFSRLFILTHMY